MGEILFLVVLFAVGGLLQAAGKRRRQAPRTNRPSAAMEPSDRSSGMLAEIQKAIEEMNRANEVAPVEDEPEEEAFSREVEPEVRSLDEITPRPERVIVVRDEAIEALAAKRLEWSESRLRPHTKADHRAFDSKIRTPEPTLPTGLDRIAELRRMIVWQEVLGKPVSLRDRQ